MKKDKQKSGSKNWRGATRVGVFLAIRQIRRASPWTNILVIIIMTLTFLNLVVVSGILVGLIQGAVNAIHDHYLGDVFVSTLKDRTYIEQSPALINTIKSLPNIDSYTARYLEQGTVEANYKEQRKPGESPRIVGTSLAGIDPVREADVAGLDELVVEGRYLERGDYDQVMVGALLLKKYLDFESPTFPVLEDVGIGDKIRVTVSGNVREVFIKGILKSKVDEIDRRIFFDDTQFRGLIGRFDFNVDEIAIKTKPGTDSVKVKNILISEGFGAKALIQTQEEAEPKFIKDLKDTFKTLGNIISSIGLVVAAITIFIVIFINAITRRKFIGILKGIGIESLAIEIAYVIQSVFYAALGTALGVVVIFAGIRPYLNRNPIDFPFSDGILFVTVEGTVLRAVILIVTTIIAGYIPAKLITRQNTLDAILNR